MVSSKKLHFRLAQDEDGYPPVAVESVWVRPGPDSGTYVLDNIPFFSREATMGDVVSAREEDGDLWFDGLVCGSENSLVRVVFFDRSAVEGVNGRLVSLGCSTEYTRDHNLLAVSIPIGVSLRAVQGYLEGETDAGVLDYEEAILRQ